MDAKIKIEIHHLFNASARNGWKDHSLFFGSLMRNDDKTHTLSFSSPPEYCAIRCKDSEEIKHFKGLFVALKKYGVISGHKIKKDQIIAKYSEDADLTREYMKIIQGFFGGHLKMEERNDFYSKGRQHELLLNYITRKSEDLGRKDFLYLNINSLLGDGSARDDTRYFEEDDIETKRIAYIERLKELDEQGKIKIITFDYMAASVSRVFIQLLKAFFELPRQRKSVKKMHNLISSVTIIPSEKNAKYYIVLNERYDLPFETKDKHVQTLHSIIQSPSSEPYYGNIATGVNDALLKRKGFCAIYHEITGKKVGGGLQWLSKHAEKNTFHLNNGIDFTVQKVLYVQVYHGDHLKKYI